MTLQKMIFLLLNLFLLLQLHSCAPVRFIASTEHLSNSLSTDIKPILSSLSFSFPSRSSQTSLHTSSAKSISTTPKLHSTSLSSRSNSHLLDVSKSKYSADYLHISNPTSPSKFVQLAGSKVSPLLGKRIPAFLNPKMILGNSMSQLKKFTFNEDGKLKLNIATVKEKLSTAVTQAQRATDFLVPLIDLMSRGDIRAGLAAKAMKAAAYNHDQATKVIRGTKSVSALKWSTGAVDVGVLIRDLQPDKLVSNGQVTLQKGKEHLQMVGTTMLKDFKSRSQPEQIAQVTNALYPLSAALPAGSQARNLASMFALSINVAAHAHDTITQKLLREV